MWRFKICQLYHGVYDLAYLRCIPNLILFAPRNEIELRNIMYTAQLGLQHPIAIRYPRGRGKLLNWEQPFETIDIGKGIKLKQGTIIAVLSIGFIAYDVSEAIENLSNNEQIAHYEMRFVKPLDEALLHEVFKNHALILTVEDGCIKGGFGSAILEFAAEFDYKNPIKVLGIPDHFIEHASVKELQHQIDLDPLGIAKTLETFIQFHQ
jgi:1-deoxy-D-xylulose-5-phosphate synthase